MKLINRFIRIPKTIVLDPRLTSEEKMFYAKLLDSIVSNETAIIPKKITTKERYMLKRLKQVQAIESYTETEQITTVKFDLKGFVTDEVI